MMAATKAGSLGMMMVELLGAGKVAKKVETLGGTKDARTGARKAGK